MHLKIKHTMAAADAVAHIKAAIDQHRAEIVAKTKDVSETWDGNTLHFAATVEGQSISGHLEVQDNLYDVEVKLPFMLRMFEGQIKKAVEAQAGQFLQ